MHTMAYSVETEHRTLLNEITNFKKRLTCVILAAWCEKNVLVLKQEAHVF